MATVTGLTAERMMEIEAASIVSGVVVGNNLILTKNDGTQINAGNVRGLQGIQGATGQVSTAALNAALAPLPKGVLGLAERTSDQIWTFQANTWLDVTGLTLTRAFTPGRDLEISLHLAMESWDDETELKAKVVRSVGGDLVYAASFSGVANNTTALNASRTFVVPAGWDSSQTLKVQVRFNTNFEVRARNSFYTGSLCLTDKGLRA